MIGNSVRYMLGGETRLAYPEAGLRCDLVLPLTADTGPLRFRSAAG